jgi:hypothetical protein
MRASFELVTMWSGLRMVRRIHGAALPKGVGAGAQDAAIGGKPIAAPLVPRQTHPE